MHVVVRSDVSEMPDAASRHIFLPATALCKLFICCKQYLVLLLLLLLLLLHSAIQLI